MLLILLFIREMVEHLLLCDQALTNVHKAAIALHLDEVVNDQLDCGSVHIMDHDLV
jgi:hypothetical protein